MLRATLDENSCKDVIDLSESMPGARTSNYSNYGKPPSAALSDPEKLPGGDIRYCCLI
jgi:hypothetical protein